MLKQRYNNIVLILLINIFVLVSCTAQPPEQQIKEYLDKAVNKAESKSAGGLKKLISDSYKDQRGLLKKDLVRISAGYFYRKQNIFIKIKTSSILIADDSSKANLTVAVAISGQSLDDEMNLLNAAEFHEFDLDLIYDNDWLLNSLVWRSTSIDDFLNF